tara:strand:- start:44542 stop:44730 length:189 start_codon:yes stop_codon:yes gene_type:complete
MIGVLIKTKKSSLIREKVSDKYGIIIKQEWSKEGGRLYTVLFVGGFRTRLSEYWIKEYWRIR